MEKMSNFFIHFSAISSPGSSVHPQTILLQRFPTSLGTAITSPLLHQPLPKAAIPYAIENPFPSISYTRRHFNHKFPIPTTHITQTIILPRSPSSPRSWHSTHRCVSRHPRTGHAKFAASPKMCLQTIGICNLDHNEHLGFHFCSLLISRGLWNPFECSCFEAIEIESYHSSCQTCLEQSVGWKIYNDRSVTLKLWRAVSRKISHHRKRRSKRQSGWVGWEMQNVCAVESASGVPSISSSKYGYLGDWHGRDGESGGPVGGSVEEVTLGKASHKQLSRDLNYLYRNALRTTLGHYFNTTGEIFNKSSWDLTHASHFHFRAPFCIRFPFTIIDIFPVAVQNRLCVMMKGWWRKNCFFVCFWKNKNKKKINKTSGKSPWNCSPTVQSRPDQIRWQVLNFKN